MIPVTHRQSSRDRSEHARELRRVLIERLQPGPTPPPRASTVVLVLTAVAIVAGLLVWIAARHFGGIQ